MRKWKKLPFDGLSVGLRVVGKGGGHAGFSGKVHSMQLDPVAQVGIARIDVMGHGGKYSTGISHDVEWDNDTQKWGARGINGTLYSIPAIPDAAGHHPYHRSGGLKNRVKRAYHYHDMEEHQEPIKRVKKGYLTRKLVLKKRDELQQAIYKMEQEIKWIDGLLG